VLSLCKDQKDQQKKGQAEEVITHEKRAKALTLTVDPAAFGMRRTCFAGVRGDIVPEPRLDAECDPTH
jgi:hypothetical protein